MKKLLLVGCIGLAAVVAAPWTTPAVAEEVSFKLVSMLPKKTPIGQAFGGFINRLNKELAGEFRIDWRGGPEVVPQFKQPNAVRIGSVDATLTSPSYAKNTIEAPSDGLQIHFAPSSLLLRFRRCCGWCRYRNRSWCCLGGSSSRGWYWTRSRCWYLSTYSRR